MNKSSKKTFSVSPVHGVTIHYMYSPASAMKTIIFLGVGQSGKNLETVGHATHSSVAVVEAFPYHSFAKDSMDTVALRAITQILEAIGSPDHTYHVIAESQAAPAIIAAASSLKCFRSVILLSPLGLNKTALGTTDRERYTSLMRRSRQFWRHPHQSLHLPGNRETLKQLLKRSLPAWQRLKSDYTYGANQDISQALDALAAHTPIKVYAGEYDSLFPFDEIALTLANTRVQLVKLTGATHLNRATPKGIKELNAIIASISH